jgi:phenylacetate-CoA ligase
MARVVGRTDDMMVIKGVNVYPSQVEAALLTLEELAPHYQLVVDRTAAFPDIAVHVEPAERLVLAWGGFSPEGAEVAALAGRVAERLRGALGLNPDIEIVPPKTIPRSEGKAVRVVERRRS